MGLTTLLDSLRNKKQAAHRSKFSHYITLVRDLASGAEIDADEAGHVLTVADKSEDDLSRDVNLQQSRNTWAAQLQANQQASTDRIAAERDLATAQRALQAAYDKLLPAVDAAHDRVADANLRFLTTQGADHKLAENVLDQDLLQREAALIPELQTINAELKPLMADRGRLQTSLENAEFQHTQKTRSTGRVAWFVQAKDADELAEIVANLQSQLRQLNALIHPRQQRQRELQRQLSEIHAEKLNP
jgi:predicted transcriptional regulator